MLVKLEKKICPPPGMENYETESMGVVLGRALLLLSPEAVKEFFLGEANKVYRWGIELGTKQETDVDPFDLQKIINFLNNGNHGLFLFAYAQILEELNAYS